MDVFDGCDIEERELSVLQVDNQCVILAVFSSNSLVGQHHSVLLREVALPWLELMQMSMRVSKSG